MSNIWPTSQIQPAKSCHVAPGVAPTSDQTHTSTGPICGPDPTHGSPPSLSPPRSIPDWEAAPAGLRPNAACSMDPGIAGTGTAYSAIQSEWLPWLYVLAAKARSHHKRYLLWDVHYTCSSQSGTHTARGVHWCCVFHGSRCPMDPVVTGTGVTYSTVLELLRWLLCAVQLPLRLDCTLYSAHSAHYRTMATRSGMLGGGEGRGAHRLTP